MGRLMWLDYVVFFTSIIISLGVGLFQARAKQRTTSEYLMGDRKLKVLPVALSLTVSYLSVITLLGNASEMHYYGSSYAFFTFGRAFSYFFVAFVMVPLLYPLTLTSLNEYLKLRFGSEIVALFGWVLQILTIIALNAFVLMGPSLMLETMAGFPMWASMITMSLVTTIYTALGGLKAVVWTDVFQTIFITAGLLTVVIKGTILAGGVSNVVSVYQEGDRLVPETSPSWFIRQTMWGAFLNGFMSFVSLLACSQQGLQRYSSVPTLADAKKCLCIGFVAQVTIDALATSCGIVTYAYFTNRGCDPLADGTISTTTQMLPYFVMEVLNYPGIPGLFIACIVCGSLSSLSSALSAAAGLTWNDVLASRFKNMLETNKTVISQLLCLFFGLLLMCFGFLFANLGGTIMQMALTIIGSFQAPILTLFLLGPLVPRVNWKSALIGGIAGLIFTTWLNLGFITNKAHVQPLPLANNCSNGNGSVNETIAYLANSTEVPYHVQDFTSAALSTGLPDGLTTPASSAKQKGINRMYQISHNWIPNIGLMVGVVVTIIASFIPGCYSTVNDDPYVFFACVRRFLVKSKHQTEPVDEIEYSMVANNVDSKDAPSSSELA